MVFYSPGIGPVPCKFPNSSFLQTEKTADQDQSHIAPKLFQCKSAMSGCSLPLQRLGASTSSSPSLSRPFEPLSRPKAHLPGTPLGVSSCGSWRYFPCQKPRKLRWRNSIKYSVCLFGSTQLTDFEVVFGIPGDGYFGSETLNDYHL